MADSGGFPSIQGRLSTLNSNNITEIPYKRVNVFTNLQLKAITLQSKNKNLHGITRFVVVPLGAFQQAIKL